MVVQVTRGAVPRMGSLTVTTRHLLVGVSHPLWRFTATAYWILEALVSVLSQLLENWII